MIRALAVLAGMAGCAGPAWSSTASYRCDADTRQIDLHAAVGAAVPTEPGDNAFIFLRHADSEYRQR